MAFAKMFKAKEHLLKVRSYSIDQAQVLGQGAFGVVFKGSGTKKSLIAAKRIDGNEHPQILTQDLDRLMQLDHPNVMKILDVETKENIVWMIMPFCGQGDLNHFYRGRIVLPEKNIDIMKQITDGIKYLHRKNIIHRDIKPGNILVASPNPLVIQLTDFDLSKCLDPEVETSLMTSNVGTLAFKAPEFFQRTGPGKIEYHRNVDIYAAGLTFLAILQAEKGKKMLIPQIETPMDDSEHFTDSIGRLIFERIKYKVPQLNIVKVEGEQESLKRLISMMTCVNPDRRLSAGKVFYILNNLETVDAYPKRQKILRCHGIFHVPRLLAADANDEDQILVRTVAEDNLYIGVINRSSGEVYNEFPSKCDHSTASLIAHPSDAGFVLECCPMCEVIHNYNTKTGKCNIVYKDYTFYRAFHGPPDSIMVSWSDFHHVKSSYSGLSILKWNKEQQKLHFDKRVYLERVWVQMCYSELLDMIVVMYENKEVEAVNLDIGVKKLSDPIWKLSAVVDDRIIQPNAITSDKGGNIYVGDGANSRILKINSLTGDVMSILFLEEEKKEPMDSLLCADVQPNLIVICGIRISSYYILKQD